MKHIFILAFLVISIGNSAAQQVTFQKTYGGTDSEYGFSVQQTTDSGYIITGQTNSFGAGDDDVYLVKTDAYGDTLWTKTYGGVNRDAGVSVKQTTDGGYIIIGETRFLGFNNPDIYLIKTNLNGDTLWTKSIGGLGADYGKSIQQTTDSGYIITAHTSSFGAGSIDVYLIKTSPNGDTLWTKTFGGTIGDHGNSVQQTTDGGFIITGYTNSYGLVNEEVFLIKADANGDTMWTKTYGGTTNDVGFCVQQTTDDGYIIAGATSSFGVGAWDVYLIRTNANGDTLWTKTFGRAGIDFGQSVQQTNDGGYIITGYTTDPGAANSDIYLVRTDEMGDTLWTKTFGGNDEERAYSVQQTSDGGYVIAGYTLSFGTGERDFYLIKTDDMGNSGCNQGNPATIAGSTTTQVASQTPLISSGGTITIPATTVGSTSTVITSCSLVGFQSSIPNPQSTISISPNPATNNFTITFPNIIHNATVSIYNIMGETIFKENIANTSSKEISLTDINAGIYFVKIIDDGEQYTQKLVVQ